MLPAHVDLGEDVLIADRLVGFARLLEDLRAFLSDPIMFEIAPTSLKDEATDGVRMPVAREHARAAHPNRFIQ